MPEAAIAVAFVVFLRILLWLAEPQEPERDPALAEVDGLPLTATPRRDDYA